MDIKKLNEQLIYVLQEDIENDGKQTTDLFQDFCDYIIMELEEYNIKCTPNHKAYEEYYINIIGPDNVTHTLTWESEHLDSNKNVYLDKKLIGGYCSKYYSSSSRQEELSIIVDNILWEVNPQEMEKQRNDEIMDFLTSLDFTTLKDYFIDIYGNDANYIKQLRNLEAKSQDDAKRYMYEIIQSDFFFLDELKDSLGLL